MDLDIPMGEETRQFLIDHFPPAYLEELKGLARAWAGHKAAQVDASGLVAEAVLRAGFHRRQLQDVTRVKAWMRTILVREVMSKLHLERHRRTQALSSDFLNQITDPREPEHPCEREDEKSWAKAYLADLLSQLSEQDREVLCLSRLKAIPDEELASLLGISPETLRQRRSRAMKRLQAAAQKSRR